MQSSMNLVANVPNNVLRRALAITGVQTRAKATKADLMDAVNASLNDRFSTFAARRRMLRAMNIAQNLAARGL